MVQLISETALTDRGISRITFTVWFGGYDCDHRFQQTTATVEIEDSFMGFGDRRQLEAWVNANHPEKTLLDWLPAQQ
jgi:hypothetical protein